MCQQEELLCVKEHKIILQHVLTIFFFIIMRIYITTKKYTVNKIRRMKNTQKHTNTYERELIQKHYLTFSSKL